MTDNPDVDRETHHQSGAEMEIIFYHPTFDPACWLPGLRNALPGANVRDGARVMMACRLCAGLASAC
jgi:hypothetical protein